MNGHWKVYDTSTVSSLMKNYLHGLSDSTAVYERKISATVLDSEPQQQI